ncbi:hypothetical protein DICPUDRAFT_75997 [Dictyostelium purpureum]|uniref:Uncharacterized protein n=1 Tax=Dictyostelium purpureum TaxID=5786 RepID=F0ZCA1_DICPU|nr:uncharacterized protein DICPUDRAFT_75997 [Dictyostelium purpureum]EGC38383.1 hypothetical protein DICPUDRAFT_75997 [Dictyostelium purpureum]|eukprot:XP_003285044.1 hypothetical protein DICPUDRAFT_75997 [Dictyostelium purpureum]
MSAINLRLLQDSEIENYGSPKNISDLMEEVRSLFDNIKTVPTSSNKISIGVNSSPVLETNSINNNFNSNNKCSNPSTILKPSERIFKLNNNSNGNNNNTSSSITNNVINNLNVLNSYNNNNNHNNNKQNKIESSFIDVKKIGLKELALLLTKRREGSVHIQAIQQIYELYLQASSINSKKQEFLDEISKGTCLRSLLSYLTLSEPKFNSFEYNSQMESIKLISILTGNDSIKTFIKQTGDISTIVQVLNWSHKLNQYHTFNLNLLNLISNLATQESCASILRKAGAIGAILSIAVNESVSNDLRIVSLNTLIIFSSYSNPKISEAIISKSSLEAIINNIVKTCLTTTTLSTNSSNQINQLSIKFLDLLFQVSDCAKTRAIACECGLEKLLSLINIDLIYPKELHRVNFFRVSNVTKDDPTIPQTNLQAKILQCLEKLAKHENNRLKIGLQSTELALKFISPLFNLPKEIFKWNTTILERILKLTIQILQDDKCKQLFVENDGCKTMLWMVQNDSFNSSILLSCAQVLGQIVAAKKSISSSINFPVDKIIDSEVIPSLITLYKNHPEEKSLQLLLCQVFKYLGSTDENKQTIFYEGGFQILHNLLNGEDLEVVSSSLDALAVLSTNIFIRKVLRLLGSISTIISKISLQNSKIQKSSIIILYNISGDDEGIELLLDPANGLSMANLNSLLFCNDSEIQISVVLLIDNLISFDKNYLEKFVDNGGIASLLNSLYSNNEKLQFNVLNLLNIIIQNPKAQPIILNSGIVNKLKSLSTHENVIKEGSTLIEPMRSFIIAVKSIPQPQPTSPIITPASTITASPSTVKSPQFLKKESQETIDSKNKITGIQIGNRSISSNQLPTRAQNIQKQTHLDEKPLSVSTGSVPPPFSALPFHSPPSTPSTPVQLPDFKKISAVLEKLNEEQLRDVVIELIKQTPSIGENISTTIRNVITGNKLPYPTANPIITSPLSSSSGIPPPPPPPPLFPSLNSNSNNDSPFANIQLKPVQKVDKKESSPNSNGMISASDILSSPVFLKRQNDPTPISESNTIKTSNSNNSPFSNLMNELQGKVGKMKLKHIDTAQEMENRRKDRLMEKNQGLLKDIVNNADLRNKTNKKTLIDSSVSHGMKIWKKSFDLYKQEINASFKRYDVLAILVFKILDSLGDFPFKDALEISGLSSEVLSQQLLRIGFNLKSSTYVTSSDPENPVTEYSSIIKPTGIPVKLILSLIIGQINK